MIAKPAATEMVEPMADCPVLPPPPDSVENSEPDDRKASLPHEDLVDLRQHAAEVCQHFYPDWPLFCTPELWKKMARILARKNTSYDTNTLLKSLIFSSTLFINGRPDDDSIVFRAYVVGLDKTFPDLQMTNCYDAAIGSFLVISRPKTTTKGGECP